MSKPVKGTSRSKTGSRRSHLAVKPKRIHVDAEGNLSAPHKASTNGTYKGRTVVDVAKRTARRLTRLKPMS